ncbi:MAG: hypothetical protein C0601_03115 [Candidatus Muiribacterium halophilum]|uniref:Uncharacterized protein n=1 Tax=Muiribacterium halophilum TaxID=2053465 RepID=A0A2N5ZK73_MUIH1|nr:MAG: hypothetical protein C0601_03115 [Candidatus Muirbacterium halophilum]
MEFSGANINKGTAFSIALFNADNCFLSRASAMITAFVLSMFICESSSNIKGESSKFLENASSIYLFIFFPLYPIRNL